MRRDECTIDVGVDTVRMQVELPAILSEASMRRFDIVVRPFGTVNSLEYPHASYDASIVCTPYVCVHVVRHKLLDEGAFVAILSRHDGKTLTNP